MIKNNVVKYLGMWRHVWIVAACCGERFRVVAECLVRDDVWRNVLDSGEIMVVWRNVVAECVGLSRKLSFLPKYVCKML